MPKQQPIASAKEEQALMSFLWSPEVADNPLNFVMAAYPWGVKGTPLEGINQPRKWQIQVLTELAAYIKSANREKKRTGIPPEMFREAISSGRGIGKSALFSWIANWHASCVIGSSTWVTANGEPQLKTKTFPEISKWTSMLINSHWFEITATKIAPAEWLAEAVQRDLKIDPGYWYIAAQLWSEENPDAFAGAHNTYGEMYLFDEASGIPAPIWTVAQGVFTEPTIHKYWLAFSNPRRNTGAFFDCFHKNRNSWRNRKIDARTVEGIPPTTYQAIIESHGEESDEARIEVYGEFPKQSGNQFIALDLVEDAVDRELSPDSGAPLIMGVDVARSGADASVIRLRQGRDARSFPVHRFTKIDGMQLAYRIAELIDKYNPDVVCIDAGNTGAGVIDRLREMRYRVNEVWFGSKSEDKHYANLRALMWGRMRDWLRGGCIDNSQNLIDDLTGPEYKYSSSGDALLLESKEDMRARGLSSPDDGDALALTFSVRAARSDIPASRKRRSTIAKDVDYDIFG
jgi:hypothetical protein